MRTQATNRKAELFQSKLPNSFLLRIKQRLPSLFLLHYFCLCGLRAFRFLDKIKQRRKLWGSQPCCYHPGTSFELLVAALEEESAFNENVPDWQFEVKLVQPGYASLYHRKNNGFRCSKNLHLLLVAVQVPSSRTIITAISQKLAGKADSVLFAFPSSFSSVVQ